MKRVVVAVSVAVAISLCAVSGTVLAGNAKVPSSVQITDAGTPDNVTVISGKVSSRKPVCRSNRRIKLSYVPAEGPDPVEIPIGHSKPGGAWRIAIPETLGGGHYGTYRAKALRRKLPSGLTCKPSPRSVPFDLEH